MLVTIMKPVRTLIALFIVVGIPLGAMIWYRNHQSTGFASVELIIYPLLFGGLGICVLLLLKRLFLKEAIRDFNAGKGTLGSDILWGLALTAVYFILFQVERLTLTDLLAFTPNRELLGLMLDMRDNPWMVLVWFGPVLWLGIALYEELVRAFLLTSLWSFSGRLVWAIAAIIIAAALVGITHWSQGPYGIVTIAIKSIVTGVFYYRHRRLFPLVLAHALYDGLQVGMLLLTYPR
jgi:membrane protease YdiL (CAAX protease family)